MSDEIYMQRCLQLASNALGNTYPNPLVGCVIVHQEKIIGQGYHVKAGEPHAEVMAINSVFSAQDLPQSTLYVSLEPCAHFGRTPPCVDLIIEKQIKRIVIGCVDPFSKVAGKGIERLKAAGCQVVVGVLKEQCQRVNMRFFTYVQKQRPWVMLKWAETLDGFIAPNNPLSNFSVRISNMLSHQLVHRFRAEEQAILIGTNTALKDNPSLTTRYWFGASPLRVLIDRDLKVPFTHRIYDDKAQTLVITQSKLTFLKENISFVRVDFSKSLPEQILQVLYQKGIQSLIVEGGSVVLNQFIDKQLWDFANVFVSSERFFKGVKAPVFDYQPFQEISLLSDTLYQYQK